MDEKYYLMKKEVVTGLEEIIKRIEVAIEEDEDFQSTLEFIYDKNNDILDKI